MTTHDQTPAEPSARVDDALDEGDANETEDGRPSLWERLVSRLPIVTAIVAALALLMVVLGDSSEIDSDLQLSVPPEVAPGAELPLRAMLYAGLLDGEGPQLLAPDVEVELRSGSGSGKALAHAKLRAANGGMTDMEGGLRVPADYQGPALVIARARVDDHVLRVDAQLRVLERAAGQPTTPRSMRALQHFSEGSVRAEPGQIAPSALRVRVAGGACVPEQTCSLLVHVGRPAAQLAVQPSAALSAGASAGRPSAQTEGVVRLDVVPHGPEAELQVLASRSGVPVARRVSRLPVALGATTLSLEPRLVEAHEAPRVAAFGEQGGCIVDLFAVDGSAEARWLRTASLRDCDKGAPLPFRELPAGMYRVQARRDALSASTAAVAAFYVKRPGETDAEVLSHVVSLVRAAGHVDPLVADVMATPEAFAGAQRDGTLRYLLAALEGDLVVYPPMVTGYAQSLYRQSEKLGNARGLALLALFVAGLSLALFVGKRGLRASERASAIMIEAGQEEEASERSQTRSTVAVIASVLALLLVFAVVGLYVMARGIFR